MAILGVVFVHSAVNIDDINIYLRQVTRVGQFGCQLFFLLSGYLMMCSWNRLDNEKVLKGKVSCFYKKRIISIFPIYVSIVILYQVLSYASEYWTGELFFYEIRHELYSVLLNVFLLHGLDVYNFNNIVPGGWFIGTIFLYYLLFPLLRLLYDKIENVNSNLLLYLPLLSVLISFVVQFFLYIYNGTWDYSKRGGYIYYSIINQLPCMLFGMNIGISSIDYRMKRISISNKITYSVLWWLLSLILFFVFRKEYYVFIFLPFTLSCSFYYLYYLVIDITSNTSFKSGYLYRKINRWGELSFAVYFSNFIAGMLMPWLLILLLKLQGIDFNPTILFIILLPFIFYFSFLIAVPIKKYIDICNKTFVKIL